MAATAGYRPDDGPEVRQAMRPGQAGGRPQQRQLVEMECVGGAEHPNERFLDRQVHRQRRIEQFDLALQVLGQHGLEQVRLVREAREHRAGG